MGALGNCNGTSTTQTGRNKKVSGLYGPTTTVQMLSVPTASRQRKAQKARPVLLTAFDEAAEEMGDDVVPSVHKKPGKELVDDKSLRSLNSIVSSTSSSPGPTRPHSVMLDSGLTPERITML